MESAEVKRGVWRRRLAIVAAIVAAAVLVWFVTTEPVRHPRQDVGGRGRGAAGRGPTMSLGSGFPGPMRPGSPGNLPLCAGGGQGSSWCLTRRTGWMFSFFPAGGEYPQSILCGYRHQRPLAAGPDHWRGDPAIHGPRPRGTGSGTGGGGPVELLCPWGRNWSLPMMWPYS